MFLIFSFYRDLFSIITNLVGTRVWSCSAHYCLMIDFQMFSLNNGIVALFSGVIINNRVKVFTRGLVFVLPQLAKY